MDDIKEIPHLRRLCDCEVCKIAYEILDFTTLLIDDRMIQKLYNPEDIAELGKDGFISMSVLKHQTVGRILSNAAAEHMFSHRASPDHIANWFATAWNNRVIKVQTGVQQSEYDKKMEDYES